jgi:hypothetical protein
MRDVSATLSGAQAVFAVSEIGLPLLNENCRGAHGTFPGLWERASSHQTGRIELDGLL